MFCFAWMVARGADAIRRGASPEGRSEPDAHGPRSPSWEMTIHGRRGSRTMKAKSWIQGVDQAFTEYLDPPRDAGTKMLKLGGQLWTFSPSTDRTIQIAGHMLRQSVMGSDMSYEDLMEDPKLQNLYEAKVDGRGDCSGASLLGAGVGRQERHRSRVSLPQAVGRQGAVSRPQGGAVRDQRQAVEDVRSHQDRR